MPKRAQKEHPQLKEQLKRTDIPRLSLGKTMTDEQLLEKLSQWGVEFSRNSFRKIASEYLSAQDLTQWLHKKYRIDASSDQQVDWIWVSVAVLWERWLPEQASLEMIDDRMQKGYAERENKSEVQACDDWLWTWNQLLEIAQEQETRTVAEFDDLFGGTQSLFNWSQDLDTELWNIGIKEPRFLNERIKFAEEFLGQFTDSYFVQRFTESAAETYFKLGQKEKADRLFEEALAVDPKWGWGWVHWSDCYQMPFLSKPPVLGRSESILKRGLAVTDVEDREYILEQLMEVLTEAGRPDEAEALMVELKAAKKYKKPAPIAQGIPYGAARGAQPLLRQETTAKAGRNELCPCESGKKFKKCCLH